MKNRNYFIGCKRSEIYEIQQKNKTKNIEKLRAVFKIFRYTTKKDRTILILSWISAVGTSFIASLSTWVFFTPLLTLFIQMETVGNPYNITKSEVPSKMANIGYAYFEMAVVNFIFAFTQILASETVSRNIMAKIKTDYLAKMLSIEISWYDKSQEQFISTVSHDLQKMMYLFDSKMASVIELLSLLILGCGASFVVSWKVTLFVLLMTVTSVVVTYFVIQLSKKKGRLQQNYNEKCTKIASEVLGSTRTVTAYGGEFKEMERFRSTLEVVYKNGFKHATVVSIATALSYLQLCICYMAAYYISVRYFLVDEFNPGNIAIILVPIMIIYHSAYMINTFSDLLMAVDSAYRVMRFLDTKTSQKESIEEVVVSKTFEAGVSFRNVHFSYSTNLHSKVLNDLTLDIEPGKVTAVVGTSGAGKSTIVGLISRLYDITAGQILIGGMDIKKLNVNWLRNQIGVVGQEPVLFDTSIEENIRYGKTTATLEEIIDAAKISYAHDFIQKLPLGYSTIVGEGGIKLSGGQKQRIAIARAIVRKPKLLLLDEATSALDTHSEGIVKKALENAAHDRTTLVIAHRMSTVKKAYVIYAMKNGTVVEKGCHSELMELKGYYYSLVKAEEQKEKERANNFNQECAFKEEDSFEKCASVVDDNNLEIISNERKFKINKRSLKFIGLCILAMLFIFITSAFHPIFYYIFFLFLESYTHKKEELNWIALKIVFIFFGLGIVSFFSVVLTGIISTKATQKWLEELQNKAFYKLVFMNISLYDRNGNSPNECLEVMTNCPPLIESVTGTKGAQVIIFFLSLILTFGSSFFISTNVTLVNIPIFLIFMVLNIWRLKSRVADTKSTFLAATSTKVATEYVQNVKTIQLLNCQNYVVNHYQDILELSKKKAFVSIVWHAVVYGMTKILIRLSMGVTFLFGTHDIGSDKIHGTLLVSILSALSYSSQAAGPAFALMSQYPQASQAMKRLYRIASTKIYLNKLSEQGDKPEISGNIVFQDVVFSYPTRNEVLVLKKLNLKIEVGKTVALVGDTGSGKSTIISLLERFYLPNSGQILIDGNDINCINLRYLRSQMSLVSQEPVLFDMTIKENILYGVEEEIEMDKIIEAAKIANIHNFITKLPKAYDTPVGERGSQLSGGQKQRIAIARAILRNPKILLLDESTSALDTESEMAVQEALEKASVGKTTIVIAHRLSTIRKAYKIAVLHSGTVVEEGSHEQLIEKRGHYFNLINK